MHMFIISSVLYCLQYWAFERIAQVRAGRCEEEPMAFVGGTLYKEKRFKSVSNGRIRNSSRFLISSTSLYLSVMRKM